jgi:hypothetical protein
VCCGFLPRLSRHSIVFTEAFDYNAPTEVRVRLGVRHGKEPQEEGARTP